MPIRLRRALALACLSLFAAVHPVHALPSVTLSWTATGDDAAVGIASRYEILVASFPITPVNFGLATRIVPSPLPLAAGSRMVQAVQLPAGGTWYFALRAMDEAGNWSPLSNVVSLDVVVGRETRIGLGLSLSPPFPQPARQEARLTAVLPERSDAKFVAYDIRGARVRTLHEGPLDPGEHEILWRLDDDRGAPVPAGIYLVDARFGGQRLVRRVVVTR